MHNDSAIRVSNLSKCYRIGIKEVASDNLLTTMINNLKSPIRNYLKYRSLYRFDDVKADSSVQRDDIIWALKNISFSVKKGDVIGVIGRNGAGKSTLLKILTRITQPTTGRVEIQGKISSLLEVGTGFHPELTGRENVYLNGAILGMKKREIDRKFDAIVEFSGVEKFLETPVKRYSSGMKVRLAFSVAAYLEPEVLLIDEVLAVGDPAFQKKCLGKMSEVSQHGRTVLFVSHNMPAVAHLCKKVIHLDSDYMKVYDDPDKGILEYLKNVSGGSASEQLDDVPREKNLQPVIYKTEFMNADGEQVTSVPACGSVTIKIHYRHHEKIKSPYFGMFFENQMGIRAFWLQTQLQKGALPDLPREGTIQCHIPKLPLTPGSYYISIGCGTNRKQLDFLRRAVQLEVLEADVFGTGRLPKKSQGMFLVDAHWEI